MLSCWTVTAAGAELFESYASTWNVAVCPGKSQNLVDRCDGLVPRDTR